MRVMGQLVGAIVNVGLGAAAVLLVRGARQRVPFTGRPHFVLVPARLERLMGANALDGEGTV